MFQKDTDLNWNGLLDPWTIGPFFGPFVGPLFGSLYLLLIVRRGWVGTLLRPWGGRGGKEGAFINKCS